MAKFKVKYKTRVKLQKAIMSVIRKEGLLDTYTLLNSVRISAVEGDLNRLNITINAVYYYMFLDKGADLWNGGKIHAFKLTEQAIESAAGKEFLSDVVQQYMDWLIATYPLLEVGRIVNQPKVSYTYNLYGDPDGKWNGVFE